MADDSDTIQGSISDRGLDSDDPDIPDNPDTTPRTRDNFDTTPNQGVLWLVCFDHVILRKTVLFEFRMFYVFKYTSWEHGTWQLKHVN